MENFTQDEFDQVVSHTIRVELIDGSVLHYEVTPEAKKACRNQLTDDSFSNRIRSFVWFYIPEDRLVLINEREIIRITFCFDAPAREEVAYRDNFNLLEKYPLEIEPVEEKEEYEEEEEEAEIADVGLDLPQLIIMHRREKEDSEIVQGVTMKTEGFYGNVSCYFDLHENQTDGLFIENFEEEDGLTLMTSKYLQFQDDDGEDNFMPLNNISVIEIQRSFILSDENLALYLEKAD